jgi:hypothetical protein
MTITNTRAYAAAIVKRKHLQKLRQEGMREFSGYGRELFQTSMGANLDKLSAAIQEYELRSGYTQLAPRNFWTTRVNDEIVDFAGGTILPESSLNISKSPQFAAAKYEEFRVSGAPVLQVQSSLFSGIPSLPLEAI